MSTSTVQPGAWLFVPHNGPWLYSIVSAKGGRFFTLDGKLPGTGQPDRLIVPVEISQRFGHFVPLVASIDPGAWTRRRKHSAEGIGGNNNTPLTNVRLVLDNIIAQYYTKNNP